MGQHLGFAKTSMMLRKHLTDRKVDLTLCLFRLVSHGPVLPESASKDRAEHNWRRDVVAAMEKALCNDLRAAGYDVLNTVNCRKELDPAMYAGIRAAFAVEFPRLAALESQLQRNGGCS
jgi:hypothetical protein